MNLSELTAAWSDKSMTFNIHVNDIHGIEHATVNGDIWIMIIVDFYNCESRQNQQYRVPDFNTAHADLVLGLSINKWYSITAQKDLAVANGYWRWVDVKKPKEPIWVSNILNDPNAHSDDRTQALAYREMLGNVLVDL